MGVRRRVEPIQPAAPRMMRDKTVNAARRSFTFDACPGPRFLTAPRTDERRGARTPRAPARPLGTLPIERANGR